MPSGTGVSESGVVEALLDALEALGLEALGEAVADPGSIVKMAPDTVEIVKELIVEDNGTKEVDESVAD